MNIPEDLKYTNDHEWVRLEGSVATIGITDHAQSELGDIVYLDMEEDAGDVESGDSVGTIEAVKTVADMYAPVSGTVTEFNESLADSPDTVNSDPYGDGWILKMEVAEDALSDLMDAAAYKALIGA